MTEASLEMLSNLRSTENLQWYVVPLIVLIVYIYNTELEKKNWNIEILFLAAIGGLVVLKGLPEDRHMKILGVPNRLFLSVVNATVAVFVEVLLNRVGLLVWEYKYWSWPHIYLIIVWWTIPYLILVWMHDHMCLKAKKLAAVAAMAVAVCFHCVFAVALEWV